MVTSLQYPEIAPPMEVSMVWKWLEGLSKQRNLQKRRLLSWALKDKQKLNKW